MVVPTGADTLFNQKVKELTFKKDLLVVIPIVGTMASITFDVGYFSGIDINLFTLFSAQEHVVFAMEALPKAALYCVTVLCGLMVWDVIEIRTWFSNLKAREAWGESKKSNRWFVDWLAMPGIFLASGALAYYNGTWENVVLAFGAIVFVFVVNIWKEIVMSRRSLLTFWSLLLLIVTYVAGYRQAIAYVASSDKAVLHGITLLNSRTLIDGMVEGRIIRTGDRGVLIYVPMSDEITLVRWEQVKAISKRK